MPHWHRTWEYVAYSDSHYASDKETRRSVYGYFVGVYFCHVSIVWRSKGIRSVVLSTTEAEYYCIIRSGERVEIHWTTFTNYENLS